VYSAGRADIDQRLACLNVRQNLIAEGADDAVVALRRGIDRGRIGRDLARQRATFFFPLGAPAIHDLGVGVVEELEYPESIARPPVVLVAVENDRRVGGHADARHQRREAIAADVVAAHRIVEIARPVDLYRARDMT
jgi:hypothetical protein